MKLPAILEGFSRKEQIRLKTGAGVVAVLAGLLYWQCSALDNELGRLNGEITSLPDVANIPAASASTISKAEGKELERKRDKYRKLKDSVEKLVPKDGGKPAPITINEIVQRIPESIDQDRSERVEDTPFGFSEQILSGYADPKNPKPLYKFQSLMYAFTLRSTYTSLVDLFRELDVLKSYFFIRQLMIHPPEGGVQAAKDPKFIVELAIGTIYVHKNQPTVALALPKQ